MFYLLRAWYNFNIHTFVFFNQVHIFTSFRQSSVQAPNGTQSTSGKYSNGKALRLIVALAFTILTTKHDYRRHYIVSMARSLSTHFCVGEAVLAQVRVSANILVGR
jgi:hypothetical protein